MPYTLHRGGATVLKSLPDDSVITDPPYNSGGRTSSDRTARTARAKYTSGGRPARPGQLPRRKPTSAPTAAG